MIIKKANKDKGKKKDDSNWSMQLLLTSF